MKVWSLDAPQLQETVNNGANQLLEVLHRDGFLTVPPEEIAKRYAIIVAEPGWFGRLFAKLSGDEADKTKIYVLKHPN